MTPTSSLEEPTMTTLTRHAITEAAEQGAGIAHLTPGQAWAANKLCIPPECLEKPLASHIATLLENVERMARRKFFDGVTPDDAETMIHRAYDENHPLFLRQPVMETLDDGMKEFFSDLKPSGVDDEGRPLYHLTDLARALEVSEEQLLAHAEQMGMVDSLITTPTNRLH